LHQKIDYGTPVSSQLKDKGLIIYLVTQKIQLF
jgi:hypothetical protein